MHPHTISTIYNDGQYLGWPTIARHPVTGRLFVAFSGQRKAHVCPFGRVMLITSDDDGTTWSQPTVLTNGPLDDRDAGLCITSRGTVIVNWFTSIAFARSTWGKTQYPAEGAALTADCIGDELGCWCRRSVDAGASFGDRIETVANSPHGPCVLAGGRLLFIGKLTDDRAQRMATGNGAPHSTRFGCAVSDDDGMQWQLFCDGLPVVPGQDRAAYHEPHAVQCPSGRIVAQIRNHNEPGFGTWQMESADGGATWTVPHHVCAGFPSHLLALRDGRLLMSYSYRADPFSNLARVSSDEGATWSAPFVFGPARPVDMGYPSTVELGDGTLASVWYEAVSGVPRAVLRMARWSL